MHSLRWTGCGAAVVCGLFCATTTAYGAREVDGSALAIERSAVTEECGHRDANEGCELYLLRRRLCERGYRLEWLRTENWPSAADISACLSREQ
jgi:hypothetical protein